MPEAELERISLSRNVLAALLEAAIAAVYLEHGFEQVEEAVVEAFDARIEYARSGHVDNKTELQEALARSGNQVQYVVLDVEGPPHDRRFVCSVMIAGEQVGIGRGSTKKAAEQEAARQALEAMGRGRPGTDRGASRPAEPASDAARAAARTRLFGSVLSHYPLRPGTRSDPSVPGRRPLRPRRLPAGRAGLRRRSGRCAHPALRVCAIALSPSAGHAQRPVSAGRRRSDRGASRPAAQNG